MAEDVIIPDKAWVYFKFTCVHCGTRVAFQEKNSLPETGECCQCGGITEVKVAGFSLHIQFK